MTPALFIAAAASPKSSLLKTWDKPGYDEFLIRISTLILNS